MCQCNGIFKSLPAKWMLCAHSNLFQGLKDISYLFAALNPYLCLLIFKLSLNSLTITQSTNTFCT